MNLKYDHQSPSLLIRYWSVLITINPPTKHAIPCCQLLVTLSWMGWPWHIQTPKAWLVISQYPPCLMETLKCVQIRWHPLEHRIKPHSSSVDIHFCSNNAGNFEKDPIPRLLFCTREDKEVGVSVKKLGDGWPESVEEQGLLLFSMETPY